MTDFNLGQNYQKLIDDLRELLDLAENGEFHDFNNKKFATPKVELAMRLTAIIMKVKHGEYDQDE